MAQRTIFECDRCRREMDRDTEPVGKSVTIYVEIEDDDDERTIHLNEKIIDICPSCWDVVDGGIKRLLLKAYPTDKEPTPETTTTDPPQETTDDDPIESTRSDDDL